jgi:RNA polymerase sigma factor (sigma-70 family)
MNYNMIDDQENPGSEPSDAGDADAVLLPGFRRGETAACQAVESWMRAAVLAAGPVEADDLQDLLQEAAVQLWRYVGRDDFALRGSFRSLAIRIVLARRIDRIRRRRFLVELDRELDDGRTSALERLQEKERLAILHRAIGSLRELCRILVRGRFLQGRSYEDLADDLDRTPETLRVHLHRCLKVLRAMLEMGDNR